MKPLEPRDRLDMIVRAFRFTGEIVTREGLRAQYRYETGQEPESRDLDAAIQKMAKPWRDLRDAHASGKEIP